jgi:hypothetical protein
MLEIGSSLREARLRLGLELSEVARATAIPAHHLEALEHERFERLPAGMYRRSFLRGYADYLGLDGKVYADEYELRFESPAPEPPGSARHAGLIASLRDELSPTRVVVVVLVVLFGVAVWQLGTLGGTGNASHPAVARQQIGPQTRAQTSTQRPRDRAGLTAAPSVASPAILTLTAARGNCWLSVQIASTSGRLVYNQGLRQGQTVSFGLRKPLWIYLGAPWNLDARIGGRTVTQTLPARTGAMIVSAAGLRRSR